MRKFFSILLYFALIPFIASLAGMALAFGRWSEAVVFVVPILTVGFYIIFRKKLDLPLAWKVNGIAAAILLICFTVLMFICSGNVESVLMNNYCWLILPFAPIILPLMMMQQQMLLFATAMITYMAAYIVTACLDRLKFSIILLPALVAVTCIVASSILYVNRPSVKYAGHGFQYMHGYSSTDFADYMVYSKNSKLAVPDGQPDFVIENPEDMPILDGAEACYPLYAAFAKAVYKDIDRIELEAIDGDDQWKNGRIVTFTNSVIAFERLVVNSSDPEKYGEGIDMFFGARPSAEQLELAREYNVELEITPIGREAFVFFVEEDNPVEDLSSNQVKAIYHGDITNWRELGGKNQPILAFQRPKNSGSQTMMEYFMGDTSLKEPKTYEKVDAMMGVVREVAQYANERGAIGYSFRYFLEELNQEKGVKMLSINGVYPSLENIENGTYPLVTNVCLITRKNDPNPNVQKMLDYILSEEGQTIVRRTGYAGRQE